MESKTFSIVTCSYQQGRYLEATIRSVLDQKYANLEYIVFDGGSSDESVEILRRYDDAITYWRSASDAGQTDALASGFDRATGELMGWLCSDDLLLRGALQVVADFFAEHPHVEAVYGDAIWIDGKGELIRQKREIPFSQFLMRFDHNYVPQPSMFWRRSVFERVGGLNPRFDLAMDADLWDRFAQSTRIAHIDKFLSCMRYYPEQKTRALRSVGEVETMEIASRSRLGRVMPLRSTLHYAARVTRLLVKLVTGRYVPAVPADILTSLERFRINDDGL